MERKLFYLFTLLFFALSILGSTNTILGVIFKITGAIYIPMLSFILADISGKLFKELTDSVGKGRKIISFFFVITYNIFIGFILSSLIPLYVLILYLSRKNHIKTVYFGVILSSVLSVLNPYYMLMPISFVFIHLYTRGKKEPGQN